MKFGNFMKSSGFHADFTKSSRFHADFMKSTWKPYKSNNSTKTLQFHGVQWEGYVSGFHENRQIWRNLPDFTKSAGFRRDQFPGMVRPMFGFSHKRSTVIRVVNIEWDLFSPKNCSYLPAWGGMTAVKKMQLTNCNPILILGRDCSQTLNFSSMGRGSRKLQSRKYRPLTANQLLTALADSGGRARRTSP